MSDATPSYSRRTELVGRVKMAKAMEMSEADWARTLDEIECEPIFAELTSPFDGAPIVRYRRLGNTRLASAFYQEGGPAGLGASPEVAEDKRRILAAAGQLGREDFERIMIHRESLPGAGDLQQVARLVLKISAHTGFFHPSALSNGSAPANVIGEVCSLDNGGYGLSFFSPHLARGLYDVDRARLKSWQEKRGLGREGAGKLRHILGVMELCNMKQGAFWRVVERLLSLNHRYFETQDPSAMAPISLRKIAAQLDFAPSTVSRVVSGKSLVLPWGREVLISDLMPGQRRVVLSILEKILPHMPSATDMMISRWLKEHHGVSVSRRTITACRHLIESSYLQQKAA